MRPEASRDGLPTLVPGRDTLPTRCAACGSGLLNSELPLGTHQRGSLGCGICAATLCWLAPPLAPLPVAGGPGPSGVLAASFPRPHAPVERLRPTIGIRFARTAGCTAACSVLYGHDVQSHEQHGASQARAEAEARPRGVVRTGPLVVDLDARRVWLSGREPRLSPYEHAILEHLAARLDRTCPLAEITQAVWGEQAATLWSRPDGHGRYHPPRVTLTRLRGKLGDARHLIETRPGLGYLLRAEPADDLEGR